MLTSINVKTFVQKRFAIGQEVQILGQFFLTV